MGLGVFGKDNILYTAWNFMSRPLLLLVQHIFYISFSILYVSMDVFSGMEMPRSPSHQLYMDICLVSFMKTRSLQKHMYGLFLAWAYHIQNICAKSTDASVHLAEVINGLFY